MKILEEFCVDPACKRLGCHWHPLTLDSLLSEDDGEYTLTVRVRTLRSRRRAPARRRRLGDRAPDRRAGQ
jgi:hypothetical protein